MTSSVSDGFVPKTDRTVAGGRGFTGTGAKWNRDRRERVAHMPTPKGWFPQPRVEVRSTDTLGDGEKKAPTPTGSFMS
jgi:hypothetical protein